MFYYTNKSMKVDVWGGYDIPSNVTSFVVTGYVDADGIPISSTQIILYCTIASNGTTNTFAMTVVPGELVTVEQGIGKITRLEDPGARVRILTITR